MLGATGSRVSPACGDHPDGCMSFSLSSVKRLLLTSGARTWVPEELQAYGD